MGSRTPERPARCAGPGRGARWREAPDEGSERSELLLRRAAKALSKGCSRKALDAPAIPFTRRFRVAPRRRYTAAMNTTRLSLLTIAAALALRSEEHTSELQSLMRISYAVFCLKKKTTTQLNKPITIN